MKPDLKSSPIRESGQDITFEQLCKEELAARIRQRNLDAQAELYSEGRLQPPNPDPKGEN